ncbi:butyrophilin subfamily 1 member A1 [Chelonia mydas]|uniref:butyrophilin subfamily 1 member A1 n=1 Tax=Chelonia mydas TaxID=8469 RepID=UPI0018A1BF59|nr:butyrophilin subfamily 1 member A1 [Chelonia mydas]XP_037771138.1 butyrophilin subfamily 1 member A1 [Chelonia mydas]
MRMQVLSFCHSTTARCSLPDLIIFFITCSLHRLESARFKVVGPDQPITATVGEEIVLPCHLSPKMSAENMEVTWFRSQLSPFVHRYSDGKDQYGQQMSEYQRRTELFKDGLTDGNVALRIFNIRPSDEGQYSCFVQEGMDYEEALLELKVSASGTAPHISVEDYQDGGIRVVCRSVGWYPQPEVLWRDASGQHLPLLSETNSKEANELFDIENSIVITENSHQNLSCVVRSTHTNQKKESTLFYISAAFFPKANPWMVALSVILMIFACFIGITIYLFKIKGKLTAELGWRKLAAPLEKENVTLDPGMAHPQLLLSVDCKSVKRLITRLDRLDNPKRFDYECCVLGVEGFTSGRHYWEVEVGCGGYWAVGIARESVRRKGEIIFSTEEGIWAVGHWGNQYLAVTSPRSPLALKQVPKKIRVFLDYEVGKVAFFDADKGVLIFTFPPASFAGEKIHPWLWVWDLQSQLRLCP